MRRKESLVNEYEIEPIPGLPEVPPEGERILWQGAPTWGTLARRAFHVRKIILYFTLIFLWYLADKLWTGGESLLGVSLLAGWLIFLAHLAVGLLVLLAWANSRATRYTITNRRVVMRFGVAVSMTINLPFSKIAAAGLRRYPDGTGDIPLSLTGRQPVSYLVLWPHVRPWRFSPVEPMLRGVPEADQVAGILSAALQAANALPATAEGQVPADRVDPTRAYAEDQAAPAPVASAS